MAGAPVARSRCQRTSPPPLLLPRAAAAKVIRTRRESQAKGSTEGEEDADLLSRFLRLRDSDGAPHSDNWIRDIIMNFIIAGARGARQAEGLR